jgi:hypothetical protein
MDNYKNLFIDINKFDENNMSYVKPVLFYKVARNMGIYYRKNLETNEQKKNKKKIESNTITKKQKIIIQTPKMIVPFGIKEFNNNGRKSYQMSLSFSTMTNLYNEEEIKKIFLFVQKIDTVNEETIMEYKKEWGLPKNLKYKKSLQRLSNEFPHHMNITLPYDDKFGFLFHVYDEKAIKSNIDIIDKKSIVSVVMELTDLKFSDNEFRSNWTAMQIRKFKPYSPIQEFFMSGCFICDEDDPEDNAYAQLVEKYKPKIAAPIPQINPNYYNHNPYHMQTHLIPPNPYYSAPALPQIPQKQSTSSSNSGFIGFKPPSVNELLDAKKLLKKLDTINKDTIPVPPPPPPIIASCASNEKSPTKGKVSTKEKSPTKEKEPVKEKSPTKEKEPVKEKTSTNKKSLSREKISINDKSLIKDKKIPKKNIKAKYISDDSDSDTDSNSDTDDDLPNSKKKSITKKKSVTISNNKSYESKTNKKTSCPKNNKKN